MESSLSTSVWYNIGWADIIPNVLSRLGSVGAVGMHADFPRQKYLDTASAIIFSGHRPASGSVRQPRAHSRPSYHQLGVSNTTAMELQLRQ